MKTGSGNWRTEPQESPSIREKTDCGDKLRKKRQKLSQGHVGGKRKSHQSSRRREERESEARKVFEEMVAENSPNLTNWINLKIPTPEHFLIEHA